MTLTELAIKRPSLVVVLFTVLGVIGLFSYTQLKYELLPKISPPIITISTIYPGASPNVVESEVSKIIEDAVSGIDKISAVRSTSSEGRSTVTIEFTQSAKIDLALQDVQRKVNEVSLQLPKDSRTPILSKIALDEIPVLRLGVTSNMEPKVFYQFLVDHIKPQLAKIEGVGQIALVGGEEREIKINLNMDKVKANGLSIAQVAGIIKASNLDFPTGNVKDTDGQFVVRIAGKFLDVNEVKNIVVARSKAGGEIRLGEIANIEDGIKEQLSLNRVDMNSSIGVLVVKQSDANTVDVARLVRAELKKIEEKEKEKGIVFSIGQDSSLFTIDAAKAVQFDLLLAIFIVALVMMLFLHSIRNSFIVMISIPTSIITTFGFMYAFGLTFNLMTLLGLSLVIGILVDDSIVVLENIYRHMEVFGEGRRTAALTGRNEIGFAALSITLVDVVVFLPLALVSGLVGNILREFSLVVVGSTLVSLLVSFTITPVLASRMAKIQHIDKNTTWGFVLFYFEKSQDWLTVQYKSVLAWALGRRWVVILLSFGLFFGSFALIANGFIGGEFITQTDRGEFAVQLEYEPGSSFQETNKKTFEIEKLLKNIPEVKKMFTTVGASSEGVFGIFSNNSSEINVALTPKAERKRSTDEIMLDIKSQTAKIPGVKVKLNPIGIFGTADQTPIIMVVNGPVYEEVLENAKKLMEITESTPGATDVKLSAEDGKPESRVMIDRQKLASYGLNIAEVGNTLKIALTGDDDSKFREANTEYAMRVQLDEYDRAHTDKLENMTFTNARGQLVELQQFATVVRTTGPTKLQRENRNSAVSVLAQNIGRPDGDIVNEIRAKLKKTPLSKGVSVTYLGNIKHQEESNSSMGVALLAGILFMYLIMVALYDSYLHPFVVLFSIPVAFVGALLALALTMKTLNIFSGLGLIMLTGLVAKNAILLVDRTNQMRKEQGLSVFDALIEAGETRLRPIIMTTISMVFGMMPIALSSSSGAEWKTDLAWVLIGGLTSSLLLTLVLVPAVYMSFENIKEKLSKLFKKKEAPTEENLATEQL